MLGTGLADGPRGTHQPQGVRGAAGASVPDAARRCGGCAAGCAVSPGGAGAGLAATAVSGRNGCGVRRRLRPNRRLRPVAGAQRRGRAADAGKRPAGPCDAAQPAFPRPASAHGPQGANRHAGFPGPAAARPVRGAAQSVPRRPGSLAALLRGLPGRLRPEAAQERRGLLHALGGGPRPGAPGR